MKHKTMVAVFCLFMLALFSNAQAGPYHLSNTPGTILGDMFPPDTENPWPGNPGPIFIPPDDPCKGCQDPVFPTDDCMMGGNNCQ